jgi:hypothetical protein
MNIYRYAALNFRCGCATLMRWAVMAAGAGKAYGTVRVSCCVATRDFISPCCYVHIVILSEYIYIAMTFTAEDTVPVPVRVVGVAFSISQHADNAVTPILF